MDQYHKNNQGYLLDLKPSNMFDITIILIILLFIFLIFSCIYKVSDYINSDLLVSCENQTCHYYLYSNLEDVEKIQKSKKIYIQKNNYPFSVNQISEIKFNELNHTNYQLLDLKIKLDKKYQKNNLHINVRLKIKEEKLIKKISKIIFEKE